ncbi:MAG TPA: helix-turn-helix transcriptional regulator [Longimicrobium sp.]|nr:helix-turn-helix transcriptional regulator [Longimicrobium sp.]
MKKRELPGIDARELFASIRRENPEIARAEAAMGSRLTIARNVFRLRVRAGITQTELARRVGTSQPRIAQIESAQANVTVDTLDRIAAAFSVQTATLFKRRSRTRRRPEAAGDAGFAAENQAALVRNA